MKSPQTVSPVHDALNAFSPARADADRAAILGIADLSHLPRIGAKGPGAADWLAGFDLSLPANANSWNSLPNGGLVGRLGRTEYLIEADAGLIEKIMLATRAAGVYPVLRQDASFALAGSRVSELLLQTCNVDFRMLDAEPSKLVLTSMAGVGVTVIKTQIGNTPCYRLWCDGTYGLYLWQTLTEIASELGGGCVGLDVLQ